MVLCNICFSIFFFKVIEEVFNEVLVIYKSNFWNASCTARHFTHSLIFPELNKTDPSDLNVTLEAFDSFDECTAYKLRSFRPSFNFCGKSAGICNFCRRCITKESIFFKSSKLELSNFKRLLGRRSVQNYCSRIHYNCADWNLIKL